MKNLILVATFSAVAAVGYFNSGSMCAVANTPANAIPGNLVAPTEISTKAQPNVPAGWITDYKAALKQANAEGKHVLMNFSGSDWCGPCIKLKKEILSTQTFKDYAKENLVLLYLDFPAGKPQTEALDLQNMELAEKYAVQGYPTLIVLNNDGKPLGTLGYQPVTPEAYVNALKEITSPQEKS